MKRRMIALLLALVLCLALAVPVMADIEVESYFEVDGVEYPYETGASGRNWSYNAATRTMELNDVVFSSGDGEYFTLEPVSFFNAPGDITLIVNGDCHCDLQMMTVQTGSDKLPALYIKGSGCLICEWISANGELILDGVKIESYGEGRTALGALTVYSGSLSTNGLDISDDDGLKLYGGTVTVDWCEDGYPTIRSFGVPNGEHFTMKSKYHEDALSFSKETTPFGTTLYTVMDNPVLIEAPAGVTPPVTEAPAGPAFTDVKEGDWFAEPVTWAVANGVTNGTSETTFSPKTTCNIAMILTFIHRAAGKPSYGDSAPIDGLSKSAYYYDAVMWSVNRMTGANDPRLLDPTKYPCTRLDVVEFLYSLSCDRYEGLSTFDDTGDLNQYASHAVAWAVDKGITQGVGNNRFDPWGICSRAQIVTFLYRYFVK